MEDITQAGVDMLRQRVEEAYSKSRMNVQLPVTVMLALLSEYQKQADVIGNLQGELKQMLTATLTSAQEYEKILLGKNERIAELEGEVKRLRELVYLAHDTECTCEICVAMPHEPIICCICNKPIEGDDLDDRFWLHAKGCQFELTGECECDLECHAACYAGHEDEYAPLFDDEDDDDE